MSAEEGQMMKGIKFASIPVKNQDASLEFYTKKLGFKVITDSPFDGTQRWIELGLPRAETKLVLFTAPGQEKMIGGFMNVTFMADDVEATAKEMKARGVEFVQDPEKADWGTAAIFKDCDGNQFVLSTP
jgi:predicted enzyme related to lactoylglutathione lyase